MTILGYSIRYREIDGWHIYDCEELPGLCVASPDPELARSDVEPSIRLLLQLDEQRSID